jgi:hypothetical protein
VGGIILVQSASVVHISVPVPEDEDSAVDALLTVALPTPPPPFAAAPAVPDATLSVGDDEQAAKRAPVALVMRKRAVTEVRVIGMSPFAIGQEWRPDRQSLISCPSNA